MKKPMKQIRQEKYQRLKKILEALRDSPQSYREIVEVVYGPKATSSEERNVQNYLAELKALELIELDEIERLYYATGTRKQIFNSKLEYNLALKHSKELFFSLEHEQYFLSSKHEHYFDFWDPFLNLDEFVYNQKKYPSQISHLKKGYFKEVWEPIQKYLLLMKKYGLDKIPGCPKISFIKHLSTEWQEDVMPEKYPKAEKGYVSITNFTDLDSKINEPTKDYCAKHGIPWQLPAKIVEEIQEMQELIIGRIYSKILVKIKNGIPIYGSCDHCPNREVIIKNGQK